MPSAVPRGTFEAMTCTARIAGRPDGRHDWRSERARLLPAEERSRVLVRVERGEAVQVDAVQAADLGDDHEDAGAGAAADDAAGPAQVDGRLGDGAGRAAGCAGHQGRGQVRSEYVYQQAADCVAVQFHQVPPNRSVLTRSGG